LAELAIRTIGDPLRPWATPFLKRGFYLKPIGMWGPNPNRNPNYGDPGWLWDCGYGGPWLWRAVTAVIVAVNFHCESSPGSLGQSSTSANLWTRPTDLSLRST